MSARCRAIFLSLPPHNSAPHPRHSPFVPPSRMPLGLKICSSSASISDESELWPHNDYAAKTIRCRKPHIWGQKGLLLAADEQIAAPVSPKSRLGRPQNYVRINLIFNNISTNNPNPPLPNVPRVPRSPSFSDRDWPAPFRSLVDSLLITPLRSTLALRSPSSSPPPTRASSPSPCTHEEGLKSSLGVVSLSLPYVRPFPWHHLRSPSFGSLLSLQFCCSPGPLRSVLAPVGHATPLRSITQTSTTISHANIAASQSVVPVGGRGQRDFRGGLVCEGADDQREGVLGKK